MLYTGQSLASAALLESLKSPPLLVTVGDRVTEFAQQSGRTPDVQVVDSVEMREKRTLPNVPHSRLIRAKNPAGTITDEAMAAVVEAFKGEKPARVLIDGEEDLLAVAAVDAAPMDSVVVYGQPGVGVVIVAVNDRSKASVKQILDSMTRAP